MDLNFIKQQEQAPWFCKSCERSRTQCSCEKLDEKLMDVIAATLIGAAALAPSKIVSPLPPKPTTVQLAAWKAHLAKKEATVVTTALKQKYKAIPEAELAKIFALAKKYEQPIFPKAADILAVVGIESSYKKTAVSSLKTDPARGLMQVRPGVWGIDAETELADAEGQIKFGSEILSKYYAKLGSVDKTVHAYNIGITNLKRGTGLNPGYIEKFHREREWLLSAWKKVMS